MKKKAEKRRQRDQLREEYDLSKLPDGVRGRYSALYRVGTNLVLPEYGALLKKVPPKVIRTEEENEAYTEVLYELDQRGASLTHAEKELAELLTLLIEDFENREYKLPRAKPLEALRFLYGTARPKNKKTLHVFLGRRASCPKS